MLGKQCTLKGLSFTVSSIPWFMQRFMDLKNLQVDVTASVATDITKVRIEQVNDLQGYDVDDLIDDLSKCLYRLNFLMKPCDIPAPYSDGSFPAVHVLCPTVEQGRCPTWDEALSNRFSPDESRVFMAAVGQVYDPFNRSRQLIYIYDPKGRSGKSRILETVFAPLKSCTCGLSKSSLNNQFGFAKVWDKQLVTIGDNKNSMLLHSQIIHSMTGGDALDVEYKGENSFSASFKGHVWVCGNVCPEIDTSAEHEVSRLVLLEIRNFKSFKGAYFTEHGRTYIGKGDETWPTKLAQELPAFLFKCMQVYTATCPDRGDIILPSCVQDNIRELCLDDSVAAFEDFFNQRLEAADTVLQLRQLRQTWSEWIESNKQNYSQVNNFKSLLSHLYKLGHRCTATEVQGLQIKQRTQFKFLGK